MQAPTHRNRFTPSDQHRLEQVVALLVARITP